MAQTLTTTAAINSVNTPTPTTRLRHISAEQIPQFCFSAGDADLETFSVRMKVGERMIAFIIEARRHVRCLQGFNLLFYPVQRHLQFSDLLTYLLLQGGTSFR